MTERLPSSTCVSLRLFHLLSLFLRAFSACLFTWSISILRPHSVLSKMSNAGQLLSSLERISSSARHVEQLDPFQNARSRDRTVLASSSEPRQVSSKSSHRFTPDVEDICEADDLDRPLDAFGEQSRQRHGFDRIKPPSDKELLAGDPAEPRWQAAQGLARISRPKKSLTTPPMKGTLACDIKCLSQGHVASSS